MDGGANISQGPGQGEAAIVQPWKNPITPQLEMAAYQQEQARKLAKEKQDQENAKIPGLDFKGLANHAPEFITGYDKIQNELQVDIKNGDRMAQQKALNKLGVLNTLINANIDLKNKIGDLATTLKTNSDKTIFPDAEKAITEATSDLQPDLLDNPAAYAKEITRRIGLVDQGLKGVARFNPQVEAIKLGAEGKAIAGRFADMGYEKFELPEAEDWVTKNVLIDPSVEYHYKDKLESNPDLKKQYGDDWGLLAKTELAPNMLVDITPKPSNGINVTVNTGDESNNITGNSVTEQVIPIGRGVTGGRDVTARVFTYPQPVNLGARLAPKGMFMIDQDTGNTAYIEGQSTPPVSFSQTVEVPVAVNDVSWMGADGKQRTVKKGEIISPEDATFASKALGEDIKTEKAIYSVGFDDKNNKYYLPAEQVAPASIVHFYGAKGATPKSEFVKKGVEKIATDGTNAIPAAQGGRKR